MRATIESFSDDLTNDDKEIVAGAAIAILTLHGSVSDNLLVRRAATIFESIINEVLDE